MKKILFVTYGSGHARMIIPVIRQLEKRDDIHIDVMALTLAAPMFEAEKIPYFGYKDFVLDADEKALEIGRKLAAQYHKPDLGIAEEEAVAYFGLSYYDLVQKYGEAEAAEIFGRESRAAFCQTNVFERVFDELEPDIVVTTNSPRSERAAVEVANARGVHSLSLVDLFGIYHFHAIEAEHIAVLCKPTIDNMIAEGVKRPREAFHITGNPAFDHAFDYRGEVDYEFCAQHYPSIKPGEKIMTWADMPSYWNFKTKQIYNRTKQDVIEVLDGLAEAAKEANAHLLIRPHPSQSKADFLEWIEARAEKHIHYAGEVPLYPLLKASDALVTYGSTVAVEALLMQRSVVQLRYFDDFTDMPLGEWGIAALANGLSELAECMKKVLYDDAVHGEIQKRVREILSQKKAAPQVATLICDIVGLPS